MKYMWIGWMNEGSHDKVWGVIELVKAESSNGLPYGVAKNGKYCTFWGRRGKKLQTKIVDAHAWDIERQYFKKVDKGYEEVDLDKLNEVYPEFEDDLKKTAFWATFKV
jgi:hypothetical protein